MFLDWFIDKLAQIPYKATAAGRVQASQKAMGQFKKNLQSGSPIQKTPTNPAIKAPPVVGNTNPVKATNPAVKSPPGAASINPGGIKPGFASKQYNPFGKQTAGSVGITPKLKF